MKNVAMGTKVANVLQSPPCSIYIDLTSAFNFSFASQFQIQRNSTNNNNQPERVRGRKKKKANRTWLSLNKCVCCKMALVYHTTTRHHHHHHRSFIYTILYFSSSVHFSALAARGTHTRRPWVVAMTIWRANRIASQWMRSMSANWLLLSRTVRCHHHHRRRQTH